MIASPVDFGGGTAKQRPNWPRLVQIWIQADAAVRACLTVHLESTPSYGLARQAYLSGADSQVVRALLVEALKEAMR